MSHDVLQAHLFYFADTHGEDRRRNSTAVSTCLISPIKTEVAISANWHTTFSKYQLCHSQDHYTGPSTAPSCMLRTCSAAILLVRMCIRSGVIGSAPLQNAVHGEFFHPLYELPVSTPIERSPLARHKTPRVKTWEVESSMKVAIELVRRQAGMIAKP